MPFLIVSGITKVSPIVPAQLTIISFGKISKPFKDKVTATTFSDDTVMSGTKYEYSVRVYSDGILLGVHSHHALLLRNLQ